MISRWLGFVCRCGFAELLCYEAETALSRLLVQTWEIVTAGGSDIIGFDPPGLEVVPPWPQPLAKRAFYRAEDDLAGDSVLVACSD